MRKGDSSMNLGSEVPLKNTQESIRRLPALEIARKTCDKDL